MSVDDVVIWQAVWAMVGGNHSLQSYFFQKEFFGELIVFRHLNMDFKIFWQKNLFASKIFKQLD